MAKIPKNFYLNNDVVTIAKQLLGKVLVSNIDGVMTSGKITEVEAYKAPEDKASHAYNNKCTKRTITMFAEGGVAYVYLCYGMHHLFNIVTGDKDLPHAILIRAIEPIDGIVEIQKRRNILTITPKLTAGPGVLTKALGITTAHNAVCLNTSDIWLEDRDFKIAPCDIIATPRIGIAYAKEYIDKPWRFYLDKNPFVSAL